MKKAIAFIILFAISIGCIALGTYLINTQMSKDSALFINPVGNAIFFAAKGISFMAIIGYGIYILVMVVYRIYVLLKKAYIGDYRDDD